MKCGISFSIFFFSWSFSTSSCKWQATSHLWITSIAVSGRWCQRKMVFIASRCPAAGGSSEVSDMANRLQLVPKRARTYRKHMRKIMKGVCSNKKTNTKGLGKRPPFSVCVCVWVWIKKKMPQCQEMTQTEGQKYNFYIHFNEQERAKP